MASREEVVEDICRVAKKLDADSLSRSKFQEYAQFSSNQLYDDGRTWSELCELAGISTYLQEQIMCLYPTKYILKD